MISRVLITGATGFLGSSLAIELVKKNFIVNALIRNTSNQSRLKEIKDDIYFVQSDNESLEKFFSRYDVELIIHTACNYGRENCKI